MCVGRRNYFAFEQLLLTQGIGAEEFELRALRSDIVLGRVDLRRREIASCLQLGSFELNNDVARFERVPFLRKNFLDPASRARCDMHFIHLDRAGDRIVFFLAAGRE